MTADVAATLESLVAETLARAGIDGPPIDARRVAAALGLEVCVADRQLARGSLRSTGSVAVATLRPEDRRERWQWALAHEIGEFLWAENADLASEAFEPAAREEWANAFASLLLVPEPWFRDECRRVDFDLFALRETFSTASHEVIAWRMLADETPTIVTIIDEGRRPRRRSNQPGSPPAILMVERQAWNAARAEEEPVAFSESFWDVQAWPIHEPGFRREILRTVWKEF